MAVRKTVSLVDYENAIAEAEKHRKAAKLARQRTTQMKASNGMLSKQLVVAQKEIRTMVALMDTQTTQVAELAHIVDHLKRDNERLRLGRDGHQNIGGNLKQIENHVWDGMWARTVSGGSAGAIGR